MKITGELLKSERISQGLTVQQVSVTLKLSSKIITAIEAGQISELPAKTFVRGFVKSYAEFLRLDSDMVLRQFQEEMGSTIPLPKIPPPMPTEDNEYIRAPKPSLRNTSQTSPQPSPTSAIKQQQEEEKNINAKIVMVLMGAIGLLILIVIGNKFFESANEPAAPEIAANSESESTNVIIPTFDTTETPESTAGNHQPSVSGTSSATTTAASAPPPEPSPAMSEDDFAPSRSKPIELIVEARKEVEVFYAKGNSKNFKSVKLNTNKLLILRSASGLHLKMSDGGAARLTVNGLDMGMAGANSKPVKLSF